MVGLQAVREGYYKMTHGARRTHGARLCKRYAAVRFDYRRCEPHGAFQEDAPRFLRISQWEDVHGIGAEGAGVVKGICYNGRRQLASRVDISGPPL